LTEKTIIGLPRNNIDERKRKTSLIVLLGLLQFCKSIASVHEQGRRQVFRLGVKKLSSFPSTLKVLLPVEVLGFARITWVVWLRLGDLDPWISQPSAAPVHEFT
jgi:hypothetical protein